MDLGIKGKRALVCAGSKGLGFGCADALAAAGVDLVLNARGAEALEAAAAQYAGTLGANVNPPQDEPDHGVTVVFIELPNTKIELLYPLGEGSPIAGFLEKNPAGGIHHICYEVDDILAARDKLKDEGARVLGSGEPKIGAHGKPVLFLHPKDFQGTLVELEQV